CGERGRRRRERDAAGRIGNDPGTRQGAHALGGGETGLQAILMEAATEMGARKPGAVLALKAPEIFLGLDGSIVEEGMGIGEADDLIPGIARRIERHEKIATFKAL